MTDHDHDWREEADRLKALPPDVQRQVIAIHRFTADDPKATRADREHARERADALERLLKLCRR